MKKNIIIVGASGFIGSALSSALATSNHNIITMGRGSKQEDFCMDADIVFYTAGTSTPYNSHIDNSYVEYDIRWLTTYLNFLSKRKSCPLFVLFSSAGTVYDPLIKGVYTEKSLLNPASKYGIGKLAQGKVRISP